MHFSCMYLADHELESVLTIIIIIIITIIIIIIIIIIVVIMHLQGGQAYQLPALVRANRRILAKSKFAPMNSTAYGEQFAAHLMRSG